MEITKRPCKFIKEMGTFQSTTLPANEYNERFCLCRGVSATLILLPTNVALYRDTFSEIGNSVLKSSEYLLESFSNAGGLKAFLSTFKPDDSGNHLMHSRKFDWAMEGLGREDLKQMAEYAQRYYGNVQFIQKLAEIKSLTGEEHEAMAGILREMAYIDYQQRHYPNISQKEIMGRSKCKLHTRAAYEQLDSLKTR